MTMKRTGIEHHTPLQRRSRPRRSGAIRPANRKRRDRERERAYGSEERRAWVKRQACANCGLHAWQDSVLIHVVNAHIRNGGGSRKADYTEIIPLCETIYKTGCHDQQHTKGWSALPRLATLALRKAAALKTHSAWLSHVAGRAPVARAVEQET